ncbi:ribonuclease R [Rhizobiales bacterium L72]|uniref:Ribonuclease R n=1 Tax=Propylenella binzhouense TaxID=2555902 RepID=A0A964T2F4_9HYPH|nr:ribonuclease R [Propylenella binzhouense]
MPTREEILAFIGEHPGKAGKREIARAFNLTGSAKIGLKRVIRELADEGLIEGKRSRLHRPGDLPSVTVLLLEGVDELGELIGVPVEWDEEAGEAPRIRIRPEARRRGVREKAPGIGDRVLARIVADAEAEGFTGKVIKVLGRGPRTTLGVLRIEGEEHRIVPIDRKGSEYRVPPGATRDAEDGELVRVEVQPGSRYGIPVARIVERVGSVRSERAISLIALEEHGIPYVFSDAAIEQAEAAEPVGMAHREDWRDLPLVTIDPRDARDHDDAVHAMPDPENPDGHIVTVAIADVAAYVHPGSPLDREALRRGNSVYFPGRVVPMLPERISNDLCSLREGEDRPAIAVRMLFDSNGRKTKHSFHRIMMRSAAKLAYEEAQAAIDGEPTEKTAPLLDQVLRPLWDAYAALKRGRENREPLAIDLPERKVVLAADGSVDRIYVPPRLDAHKLIEEYMIQANVSAAETLERRKAPVVYRIHDEPSFEKLEALRDFLGTLDMRFPKAGNLRPSHFNRVLERFENSPNELLVNEVVLRSQSQAEYAIENIGHFGLNLRRYAHFTSPIRRYADLLVHRALIHALELGPGGLRTTDIPNLERIAGEISIAERRAMAAERDTIDRVVAAWLADRVGARFAGHVRGVTRAGLFVELDDSGADGFIPISTLGRDFYEYDEPKHRLVGRTEGEVFRLGDAVEVRLAEALPFAGSLRFELVGGDREGAERGLTRKGKRPARRTRGKEHSGREAGGKEGRRARKSR